MQAGEAVEPKVPKRLPQAAKGYYMPVLAQVQVKFSLCELRQHVLLPLVGNPLFSKAEQLRANHFMHEREGIAQLTRWGSNVSAEITRRQAARVRRYLATSATLARVHSTSFREHCSCLSQPTPSWVPSTFFPDRADRWAAARFQQLDSLTLASLLSRQSR